MNEDEYKKELEVIENDYRESKKHLACKYAMSNAKFKVGDIIQNNVFTIKVEVVKWSFGFMTLPYAVYGGAVLKKDLTPKKNGETAKIFGSDKIVKLN